jgi:hypothetical protein
LGTHPPREPGGAALGARTLPLPLNHMCFNPDSVYSCTVKKTEQENALARKKGLLNVLILANVY